MASLPSCPDARKRCVSYFYEPSIRDYVYAKDHPMQPIRIGMTHDLIAKKDLVKYMEVCRPVPAIRAYHSPDYVNFLSSASSTTVVKELQRFTTNVDDCPIFDGLFEFCKASVGGSIGTTIKLNNGDADIAINWSGGLHHAKKSEVAGFCYVNDIVLGIIELLKKFEFAKAE